MLNNFDIEAFVEEEGYLNFIDRVLKTLFAQNQIQRIFVETPNLKNYIKYKIYTIYASPKDFEKSVMYYYAKIAGEFPLLHLSITNSPLSKEQIIANVIDNYKSGSLKHLT